MNYPTEAELFSIIAKTQFKPFTEGDWYTFAGCESENPLIGYDGEFAIVIDGETVNIVHGDDEYGGQLYTFKRLA